MKDVRDIISFKFENEETRYEDTGCDVVGWGEVSMKSDDGYFYVRTNDGEREKTVPSPSSSFFTREVTYQSAYRHRKDGWDLNPNPKVCDAIIKRINKCGGQCPCDNDSYDKYCPCSNYILHDHCCCMLYVRKEQQV